MSFSQRLTKIVHQNGRKPALCTSSSVQITGKQSGKRTQFNDFQQHHSDLKDILRMLQTESNPSHNQSTEAEQRLPQKPAKKRNNRTLCDTKQNKYKSTKLSYSERNPEESNLTDFDNFESPLNSQITRNKAMKPESKLKDLAIGISGQKRGLENIGNTCYINSILQCLFHLVDFSDSLSHEFSASAESQENSVVSEYMRLYEGIRLSKGPHSQLSTLPLKRCVSKMCSLFLDFQQEDAHEFMRQLLDTMHQKINRTAQKPVYKVLYFPFQDAGLASIALEYRKRCKQFDDSCIYDSFSGELCSFVSCSHCRNESVSFENFLDLSLPLLKGVCHLEGLIQQYFESEVLWDFYSCSACGRSVKKSLKRMDLWSLPPSLVINLKRCQFVKKNVDRIKIPTKCLNMRPFLKYNNHRSTKSYQYRLKGAVMHRGSVDGGHYWAFVQDSLGWYKADDAQVQKIPTAQIIEQFETRGSESVYLLFYQVI